MFFLDTSEAAVAETVADGSCPPVPQPERIIAAPKRKAIIIHLPDKRLISDTLNIK
jgi:hypothetical protein